MRIRQVLTKHPGCILTPSHKDLQSPGGGHGLPKTFLCSLVPEDPN